MIGPRLSTYLDLLRLLAAVVVLLSHLAYERFTDGAYLAIRQFNLGSDAVVVFFVLSGFVIAHTARAKDGNIGQYFFNRATRIYSVAIPAILLTFILDRNGAAANFQAYNGWWYNPASLGEMLLMGTSFCSEWNINGFRLGTNGPYWSLSYEVAYYVLFAIAFYLRGFRRVAWLAIAIVVAGPKILLLTPVWLMGVALYHVLNTANGKQSTINIGWLFAIAPAVLYLAALTAGMPKSIMSFSHTILSPSVVQSLRFSDEFIWNAVVGLLFSVHLFGVATIVRSGVPNPRTSKSIKWLAGASFSLYLVHYPVIQYVDAVLPETMITELRHGILLLVTVVVCFAFAELFERRLGAFRRFCTTSFARVGLAVGRRREPV
ncbi:MAG: peptidoglycan/LPS O-acetylase OafA/YrhL [Pirellulaceae bacterium]|jgi:peptidoglycan/LPS O-acetylase OafA/YrhL